ncbi:MAG: ABC transporter ATP-binding protein [Atribacterota bacterium]
MNKPSLLLDVKNLRVFFYNDNKEELHAVDGVTFQVYCGETVALVGESGCGKSVTSLALLRLIDSNGRITGGEITFAGINLLHLSKKQMQGIRGKDISMIFQEPSTALNPVFTIGDQIMETIILHQHVNQKEARDIAEGMLKIAGIPDPGKRLLEYPHELSGGMKQRAMIAMALSCRPKLLIADEPTTSLDVTIQAQILELIRDLQQKLNMAVILITHDLGIVADMANRIIVMYAGKIVEEGNRQDIFKDPSHPYTIGLLRSIPRLDIHQEKLSSIPGMVPDPVHFPSGCRFRNRCPLADPLCQQEPSSALISDHHFVYCHHWKRKAELQAESFTNE